jgi:hypothetical protein
LGCIWGAPRPRMVEGHPRWWVWEPSQTHHLGCIWGPSRACRDPDSGVRVCVSRVPARETDGETRLSQGDFGTIESSLGETARWPDRF